MDENELIKLESSQRQLNENAYHIERMNLIIEQQDYSLFVLLKPKLTKDGSQWCVLYGETLQEGIAGFGNSPYEAILSFNKEWHKH